MVMPEMRALSKDEILSILRERKEELLRRYSVRKIGLFGSWVRESPRNDSDIDLLVELEDPTFDHFMDLKFFLEDLFGRPVDLVMAETVKPRLRSIIAGEVSYA
jgi:predicted nucleotidyltransferase